MLKTTSKVSAVSKLDIMKLHMGRGDKAASGINLLLDRGTRSA